MDERKVSKARMSLVTSGCPRIRAPNLEHAAWQNGTHLPFSHRTRSPHALTRKVNGTRPPDRRWVPVGFSQGPAYKSRPGLFTRPPSRSRSQTDTAVPYTADHDSHQSSLIQPRADRPPAVLSLPFLRPWLASPSHRRQTRPSGSVFSLSAESPLAFLFLLASKPEHASKPTPDSHSSQVLSKQIAA